jgi:4a-hydroxytetrahydrobiopterin dehydratase
VPDKGAVVGAGVLEVAFVRVDTQRNGRQDRDTKTVTVRRRFGHKPATTLEVLMGVVWKRRARSDYLSDALSQLAGWIRDGECIKRTLQIDDSQHALLTERITIAADALGVRPQIRRLDGWTQIRLCHEAQGDLTPAEVGLAARIEAVYSQLRG